MKKSQSLVDRIKTGAKTLAVGAAIGLAAMSYSPNVAEAHVTNQTDGFAIHSFEDFVGVGVNIKYVESSLDPNTHLKVLDTVIPASVVEEGSHWYIGFINYIENSSDPNLIEAKVVGYAENRWSSFPDLEGYMWGKYLHDSNHLQYGEKPEDIYIVHDGEGDGLGYIDGGAWSLGADDKFYYSKDVMFGPNKVYGDVNELPALPSGTTAYLPEIIVDARPIRTGTSGMNELLDLTENWLSQDCHPYNNNDCNEADWNFDGDIDFYDFSHMAVGWDPNYVAPMSSSSSSSLESLSLLGSAKVYSTVKDESGVYVADSVESNVPYTSESDTSYLIKTIVKNGEVIATFE